MDQTATPRQTRVCPDCHGTLDLIRIIDKGHFNFPGSLEYARIDAQPGFWTGSIPVEGKIDSLICTTCGRVFLYGSPKEEN